MGMKDRFRADRDFINGVLNDADDMVVALNDGDGAPYAFPVNFVLLGDALYIHTAFTGKKMGGCQLNNDAISFQLPLTWNLAKSAIVRSTISRVLDTTIDFLLKRANQCLCLPLFCSRYTVCDLL